MYIPFVSLVKRLSPEAVYYRSIYTDASGDKWWPNDAYGDPRLELLEPKATNMWRLDEASSNSTAFNGGKNSETLTYSQAIFHSVESGPCREISAAYGRGGQPNPDVFSVNYIGTGDAPHVKSAAPQPAPGATNPSGVTDGTIHMQCWFRIRDLSTVWAADNSSDDADGTQCCIMSLSHYAMTGSSWGPRDFKVKLIVTRHTASSAVGDPPFFTIAGKRADTSGNSIEAKHIQNKYSTAAFALNDTDWHLLTLESTPSTVVTWIDGHKIYTASGSTINIPGTPQMQVGINYDVCDIGASKLPGCRNCQIAYASMYQQGKVNQDDVRRHYSSMKRWMDQKVTDYHFTEPLATGSVPVRPNPIGNSNYTAHTTHDTTDLQYSVPCKMAAYRHDGRYANVIRLNNPWHDDYSPSTRLELLNDNDGGDQYASNIFRNERELAVHQTGGMDWHTTQSDNFAGGGDYMTQGRGDLFFITGYDGFRIYLDPAIEDDYHEATWLMNFISKQGGGGGWANSRHGNYPSGPILGGNSPVPQYSGWGVYRDGNNIHFVAPYALDGSTSNPYQTQYADQWGGDTTGDSPSPGDGHYSISVIDNRYQCVGWTVNTTDGLLAMKQQSHVYPNGDDKIIEYTKMSTSGSGTAPPIGFDPNGFIGSTYITAWPFNIIAPVVRGMFLQLGSSDAYFQDDNGQGGQYTGSGDGTANDYKPTDRNRYGPTAICSERIEEHQMRRVMRIMHGQRLHRSRPALRGSMRHMALSSPTRILT